MGNEKIVIEIIDKISDHGEAFTFHDNEGTDHGMAGKTFTSRFWVFLNERQIKIQEKGIIKFSNWLCCKKTDVFYNFLTVDSNQLLSGFVGFVTLIIPDRADCYYKYRAKGSGSDKKICNISQNRINTGCVKFCSRLFIMLYGGFYYGEFYSFKLPRQQK